MRIIRWLFLLFHKLRQPLMIMIPHSSDPEILAAELRLREERLASMAKRP